MIDHVLAHTLPSAFALLPPKMDTPAARAMLLAIGLQESGFAERRQRMGPARGFWQFEVGGVLSAATHRASALHVERVLNALIYPPIAGTSQAVSCQAALEHNDVLAACLARLLLYTLPMPLPTASQPGAAWAQYHDAWRPGRPLRQTWDAHYADAWARVGVAVRKDGKEST